MELAVDGGKSVALLDDDQARLACYTWRFDRYGYVYRKSNGRRHYLHHVVIGKPESGSVTDHVNRDKLDNRRENLRHISRSVSQQNVGPQKRNVTGIRGARLTVSGRYQAYAGINGRQVKLGRFDTAEQAGTVAAAYRRENLPFSID